MNSELCCQEVETKLVLSHSLMTLGKGRGLGTDMLVLICLTIVRKENCGSYSLNNRQRHYIACSENN